MTRGAEIYVRLVTFLVGLVLTGLGTLLILWYAGVNPIADWFSDQWPKDHLESADKASWWMTALVATAVVIILWCVFSLIQLTKRRSVDTLLLDAQQPGGAIHVALSDIGRAVARDLENLPDIRTASTKAINDRGVKTLDIDLQAPADTPLETLIGIAEQVAADVPAAVSYCGPTTRIFLQLDKVRRPDGTTSSTRFSGKGDTVQTHIPHS